MAGAIFHEWVAQTLRGGSPDLSYHPLLMRASKAGLARAKARAAYRIWQSDKSELGEIKAIEAPFEAVVGDIRWTGRVDQIVQDGHQLFIVELKTTSNPNFTWYQSISDQLLIYSYFLRKAGLDIQGGIWDVIVLPRLREKKGETLADFEERLVSEAMSAGPRVQLPQVFTEADFQRIEEEIFALSEEIAYGRIYRNPAACVSLGCAYMTICLDSHQAENFGFVKREAAAFAEQEG